MKNIPTAIFSITLVTLLIGSVAMQPVFAAPECEIDEDCPDIDGS